MTLTDASLHIAAALGGAALLAAATAALRSLRRRRYQGPASEEPYAGFQTGARTGELLWLECHGHCPGTTTHEAAGDGEATCRLCGTARLVPAPDAA
ncbi:hypothetical protein ACKI1J_42865 [Streptomyces scabiei]|uniref:hypothetical protein n=1 Tax=Streptomyces TaxID=1883 RepID=UPI0029AE2396|nr:hypothetical protein [Streptomyces stelliscabiei]MDX2552578.1 hypothetical protein [Streptomyces stelliscabiei]